MSERFLSRPSPRLRRCRRAHRAGPNATDGRIESLPVGLAKVNAIPNFVVPELDNRRLVHQPLKVDIKLHATLINAKSELRAVEYLLQEAGGSEQSLLLLRWSHV